jgi:hypothetical protein
VSYFSDTEASIGNSLKAAAVFLSGGTEDGSNGQDQGEVNIGEEAFTIHIDAGSSSVPLLYTAHAELSNTNPPGCDQLVLGASFGSSTYSGLLKNFVSPTSSVMGDWKFLVSDPIGDTTALAPNAICRHNLWRVPPRHPRRSCAHLLCH